MGEQVRKADPGLPQFNDHGSLTPLLHEKSEGVHCLYERKRTWLYATATGPAAVDTLPVGERGRKPAEEGASKLPQACPIVVGPTPALPSSCPACQLVPIPVPRCDNYRCCSYDSIELVGYHTWLRLLVNWLVAKTVALRLPR